LEARGGRPSAERFRAHDTFGIAGQQCPVDRFVFGNGTPDERHATKVNGVPYRPRGVKWPHDFEGRPLTFLAQFCFADSKDHIGELPGDVLVIFMRTSVAPWAVESVGPLIDPYDDINSLVFEWYPIGLDDLIDEPYPEALPFEFPTCFAVRYRTTDFVEQDSAIAAFSESIADLGLSKAELRGVFCHPGMKIGGSPFWLRAPDPTLKGRFIASFWGVNLTWERPFPWVGESRRLSLNDSSKRSNMLLIRDGCCINSFLTEDGSIDWDAHYF
jgi:Domain of unknown function (DUF1963)